MSNRIDLKEERRLANLKAKFQKRYDQLKTDRAIQTIEANTDKLIRNYIVSTGIILMGSWLISVAILRLF